MRVLREVSIKIQVTVSILEATLYITSVIWILVLILDVIKKLHCYFEMIKPDTNLVPDWDDYNILIYNALS